MTIPQKILIVGDTPMVVETLKDHFITLGFSAISEVSSGKEALETLAWREFDLICSELSMKDLSGLDLLRLIRSSDRWKRIPFIMITPEFEREGVIAAIESGATDYLALPFTEEMIRSKLNRLWRQSI